MVLSRGALIVILSLVIPMGIFAQQNREAGNRPRVEITGTIIEHETQEPIEQATVRLLSARDSSFVGGVVSSNNGVFSLKDIRQGEYILNVSFVGLKSVFQNVQARGQQSTINVGKIELADNSIALGEAVVIGKMAEVTVRNDTIEYNAGSYKIAEGSALEELLKKMPGVEIDEDGKVTVNGKEITKIMVDGKEFFTNDPKVASKNLPADIVDKIQVFERRSDMAQMTGFDDGNEEPTINLTIKPGMKQGWFGNAFAGYGSQDRYEGNAMVNRFINNDQITVMGGLNNTNNMGFSDLSSTMMPEGGGRRFFGGPGSGITSSGNVGLNFSKEFSPKSTLSGNARYSHSDNDSERKIYRENILSMDSTSLENERSVSNSISDNIGAEFRLEWKPDTTTTILFRPEIGYSRSQRYDNRDIDIFESNMDTISMTNSLNTSDGEGYNVGARLELSKRLNNSGRVLSLSLSGSLDDSYTNGSYYNLEQQYYLGRDSLLDQRYRYDNTGSNYRAFASWVEPIGRNNFIQLTYSFSQRQQESLRSTYSRGLDSEEYNLLDTAYSRSFRNNFITQRAGLSFRAQREKYNYTIGLNVDPSYSSSENFVGDDVLQKISRDVINISPNAQFNYIFNRQSNLRISYNGRTNQPSMTQLQPVADLSDPINTIIGNPDLKPRYTNNLSVRLQTFQPESQTAFMIFANGNYVVNDIVSSTTTLQGGRRETTYENVNGNYNGNVRMIMNSPLKNKRFTVNSMSMASHSNSYGFSNAEKNQNNNLTLMERLGLDYRSDLFDLGVSGNIRYNKTTNTLQAQNNRETYNYGVGGTTTIYLPLNFRIESDINYSTNSGYAAGYEQSEVLWNASASKTFLKNNQGTLRFKIYDILQQRSNISQSQTANYTQFSETNTLSSYFMVHFIYRFSIFKGGASAQDMRPGGRRPGGPGPGGPGGPVRF